MTRRESAVRCRRRAAGTASRRRSRLSPGAFLRRAPAVAAAALLLVAPTAAEPLRLEILPADSRIAFTLEGNIHTVHGEIAISGGTVHFDPGDGSLSGRIVADARSAYAENPKVVKRMHKEILESARFPEIVFAPERIEVPFDGEEGSTSRLSGSFELHGSTHPVTMAVTVSMDEDRITARGNLDIPYVEWGLKDPSRFLFRSAPVVGVEIVLHGRVVSYPEVSPEVSR